MAPDKVTVPKSFSSQFPSTAQTASNVRSNGSASNINLNNSNGDNKQFSTNTTLESGTRTRDDVDEKGMMELSDMLNTGLTKQQLTLCVVLLKDGIPPRLLADFVKRSRNQR